MRQKKRNRLTRFLFRLFRYDYMRARVRRSMAAKEEVLTGRGISEKEDAEQEERREAGVGG